MIEQHYTVEEVAAKLAIKPRVIREYLKDKKLRGVKINERSWRIPESAITEFLG
jgi:excisionase family DNA binding protein